MANVTTRYNGAGADDMMKRFHRLYDNKEYLNFKEEILGWSELVSLVKGKAFSAINNFDLYVASMRRESEPYLKGESSWSEQIFVDIVVNNLKKMKARTAIRYIITMEQQMTQEFEAWRVVKYINFGE